MPIKFQAAVIDGAPSGYFDGVCEQTPGWQCWGQFPFASQRVPGAAGLPHTRVCAGSVAHSCFLIINFCNAILDAQPQTKWCTRGNLEIIVFAARLQNSVGARAMILLSENMKSLQQKWESGIGRTPVGGRRGSLIAYIEKI